MSGVNKGDRQLRKPTFSKKVHEGLELLTRLDFASAASGVCETNEERRAWEAAVSWIERMREWKAQK